MQEPGASGDRIAGMPAASAVVGTSRAEMVNGHDAVHMNGDTSHDEPSTSGKVRHLNNEKFLQSHEIYEGSMMCAFMRVQ